MDTPEERQIRTKEDVFAWFQNGHPIAEEIIGKLCHLSALDEADFRTESLIVAVETMENLFRLDQTESIPLARFQKGFRIKFIRRCHALIAKHPRGGRKHFKGDNP